MDFLFPILLGIMAGTIAGMLPGVGVFISLLLLYPFLITWDPLYMIITYCGIISASQFIGSIGATIFGVPGETSSLPAVREGHRMFLGGRGAYAISGCAIGSTLGSLLAIFLTFLCLPYILSLFFFFNNTVQVIVLLSACCALISLSQNKLWISIFLACFGYFLGMIGTHPLTHEEFFTFGRLELYGGLPLFPVLVSLYVVPELIRSSKIKPMKGGSNYKSEKFWNHLKTTFREWKSICRGTFFGYWGGLVPGLTYILSSNVAYAIEKKIQEKKEKYREDGDFPSLVSAETANNSGAFSSLLPLLILGIPITGSEALLYEMVTNSGMHFGLDHFKNQGLFLSVGISLLVINAICLVIAWPFAKYLSYVYRIPLKVLNSFILILLVGLIYYVGSQTSQGGFYFLIFLSLLPIGIFFKRIDTLPLVFAFILQEPILESLHRLQIIWG